PTTGKMTGDLTIHGVTKPVTFDVTYNGGLKAPIGNAYDLGFHATTTIKRSDFGLDKMMWNSFVGDDVKLTIEAMFLQQKAYDADTQQPSSLWQCRHDASLAYRCA